MKTDPPRIEREVKLYRGNQVITDRCKGRWPTESANAAWSHLPLSFGEPTRIEVDGVQIYPELSDEQKTILGIPKRKSKVRPERITSNKWFKIGVDLIRWLDAKFTDPVTGKKLRTMGEYVDSAIREKITREGGL
jgi:hypothetical protein